MENQKCFHCGNQIVRFSRVVFDQKNFCCLGCKTVYEILSESGLSAYYSFEKSPGASPGETTKKYDFLDQTEIADKLLDFKESNLAITTLYIPHIHCSSCIWILENLNQLHPGVLRSIVNFPQKQLTVTFNPELCSLKQLVTLLDSIGYSPYISLKNYDQKPKQVDRSLLYRIGVAFFSFGNVMMLSFPEYFNIEDFWIIQYREFFRWLILLMSLPVFFYSAFPYHLAAYNGIRTKNYTIDIPMSLGIIIMFIRSVYDIVFSHGQGFFDSMCMLVFFMLLGKLFQQRTYNFLSFERDYKSYFPIAVTKINDSGQEVPIQVYDIEIGDQLLIRNQELLPVDGILISESASMDYSFVTGEAEPLEKKAAEKLFAGGKQIGGVIQVQAIKTVSQSYLTQLWSNEVFQKKVRQKFQTITDSISHYFTPWLLIVAVVSFGYWSLTDWGIAFNVFTAILIIACPCALALSAPFTLGNVIRIMGRAKFYVKNTVVVEQMAQVDTVVFDKTGTITSGTTKQIIYEGEDLTVSQIQILRSLVRGSNHPLSRRLYGYLPEESLVTIQGFEEIKGQGIQGIFTGVPYRLGSALFVGAPLKHVGSQTSVYLAVNGRYVGRFIFQSEYRKDLARTFKELDLLGYDLVVLSGDNNGEQEYLEACLPKTTAFVFNQRPEQKLDYIAQLQSQGKNVMMIGDGLNDAGALAQSNVGISIAEDVNVFTPASDAILDATQFNQIPKYLSYSKNALRIIKSSYVLALTYNTIGIGFAITNNLSPLVAAILMPISTISIISYVTLRSKYYGSK